MRNILIFLFSFMLNTSANAQQDSVTIVKEPYYLKYYELDEEQWDAWMYIDSVWTIDYFKLCLAENGFRLNCEDCESAYYTVKIDIDSAGVIKAYQKVKSKICGEEFSQKLEKSFMQYFLNIKFPANLRNMKLEVRIGDGLKC